MDITYSQKSGIKLVAKGLSVVFDPADESKSDVALLSKPATTKRTLTTFDGPGEYEVRGCMIDGIALAGGMTGFRVELDDLRLGYLPVFPQDDDKGSEALSGCDVLFVPLKEAKAEAVAKLTSALEPKLVVPVHYTETELNAFLSEMGAKDVEPTEKLKLQRKDLADDKQEVRVLSS